MSSFVIVKCLVVNAQGEILVVRRGQTAPRRAGEWDLPGGFVDDGEDLTEAVVRETQEEAGIKVERPRLVFAMSEATDVRGSGSWLTFVANVAGTPAVTLSYEHDEYKWVALDEALEHISYDRQQKMLRYVIDNHLTEKADDADA